MRFIIRLRVVLGLSLLLLVVGVRLSTKFREDQEKIRPFECGFTPKSTPRLPLSLRFFLVAIVFLIFDVELVLIFPIVLSISAAEPIVAGVLLIIFLIILLAGLYYEINQGRLN